MSKIKEITISNFRAYFGDHKFSFLGKNGLANLIVIYGPNGYGKTSFFDAVEFTLSDSIRRFENKVAKVDIESRDFADEELKLLSNRFSDKVGEVTIVTEDNKSVKRIAYRRKLPNGPYYDYKRGDLRSDIPAKDLLEVYHSNLLSQDQIDSFLRLSTPEEKFSELQEFWPQGETAAAIFKKLAKYRRLLKDSLTDTNKNINEHKDRIDKFLNTEGNLERIRERMRALNNSTVFHLMYPDLPAEISEKIYLGILDLNQSNIKRITNKLNEFPVIELAVESLIEKHSEYVENGKLLQNSQRNLDAINLAKKRNVDLHSFRDRIEKNVEQVNIKRDSYTRVETLKELWPAYMHMLESIIHLKSENETELRKRERLLGQIGIFAMSADSLETNFVWRKDRMDSWRTLSKEMDGMIKGIEKNALDEKDGNEILQYLDGVTLEIELNVERLQQERAKLQLAELEDEIQEDLIEFEYFRRATTKIKLNIEQLDTELKQLTARSDQQKTFEERLETIINWGIEQVQQKHLDHCILCNTPFRDFESLISSMRGTQKSVLDTTALEEEIAQLTLIRLHLSEEKLLLDCEKDDLLKRLLKQTSDEISGAFTDRELVYNMRSTVAAKVEYAADYMVMCVDTLADADLPVATDGYDFTTLVKINQERITLESIAIERLKQVIEFKNRRRNELELEIALSKLHLETNENTIELFQAEPVVNQISGLIEYFKLKADHIDFQILMDAMERVSGEERELLTSNRILLDEFNALSESILSDPVKYDGDASENLVEELSSSISNLKGIINEYQDAYRLISDSNLFEIETIKSMLKALKQRIENHQNLKEDLEKFSIELEVIQENIILSELKDTLEKLTIRKEQTEVAKNKIDWAHADCGDFINLGIKEHFNTDLINRIYGKIDPHPGLKEIEISSEISGEDKAAKLQIRAKNKFDRVNPVFYFSTGQVNVLSLSIFLAKAFELGSEAIDTIFMDDPVQNLSDINVLSFIDLLRTLIEEKDKQIVISTHDEKFFRLLQNKLSDDYFKAKYFELISYGELKDVN